jgi:hypothetical protein
MIRSLLLFRRLESLWTAKSIIPLHATQWRLFYCMKAFLEMDEWKLSWTLFERLDSHCFVLDSHCWRLGSQRNTYLLLFVQNQVKVFAGPRAAVQFPQFPVAKSFHIEYGERILTFEFVDDVNAAISHINKYVLDLQYVSVTILTR